jgi:xanthine/uracil/vitamin C permease (AzgA family)
VRCSARRCTSTTTAYIESAAGVEEGVAAHITALRRRCRAVLASLFLAPLAQTVPPAAPCRRLFVACLMATSLGAIQWDEPTEYIPASPSRSGDPVELFHRHRDRAFRSSPMLR